MCDQANTCGAAVLRVGHHQSAWSACGFAHSMLHMQIMQQCVWLILMSLFVSDAALLDAEQHLSRQPCSTLSPCTLAFKLACIHCYIEALARRIANFDADQAQTLYTQQHTCAGRAVTGCHPSSVDSGPRACRAW